MKTTVIAALLGGAAALLLPACASAQDAPPAVPAPVSKADIPGANPQNHATYTPEYFAK